MNNANMIHTPIDVWLGHFVTTEQMTEINYVQQIVGVHRNYLYPHTQQGKFGFQQLHTVEQQAFCQMLAHQGCIASCLLFGFSLSTAYQDSRRIICLKSAYEYAFVGMEGLLMLSSDTSFRQQIESFADSFVFYRICEFLVEMWHHFGGNEIGRAHV